MSEIMHRTCVTALGLSLLCIAQSASADTFTAPTSSSVEARIGQERLANGSLGDQWLVWKRRSTGACLGSPIKLGGTSGLSEGHTVRGWDGNDLLVVQAAFEAHCGKNLGPLKANGHTLVIMGRNGHDIILGGVASTGTVSFFGGNGNDVVAASGVEFIVMGEGGSDDVEAWGPGFDQYLMGDGHDPGETTGPEGADCLWDQNHQAIGVTCYGQPSGTQDRASFPSWWNSIGCEVQNTSVCCAWAHFAGGC